MPFSVIRLRLLLTGRSIGFCVSETWHQEYDTIVANAKAIHHDLQSSCAKSFLAPRCDPSIEPHYYYDSNSTKGGCSKKFRSCVSMGEQQMLREAGGSSFIRMTADSFLFVLKPAAKICSQRVSFLDRRHRKALAGWFMYLLV